MGTQNTGDLLGRLRQHLPSQAALKDFIHHNTLHAYQDRPFHQALWEASQVYGYATYLSVAEYQQHYANGRIIPQILCDRIERRQPPHTRTAGVTPDAGDMLQRMVQRRSGGPHLQARIGRYRAGWKKHRHINLSKSVHPLLFRLIAGYLDQGVGSWDYPYPELGLTGSIRRMTQEGATHLFRSQRVRNWMQDGIPGLTELLQIVVGDPATYETYLFDQQFEHPGWAGFVATLEVQPETLLDSRKISLEEWIKLELLLEIDALDHKFPAGWQPLSALAPPEFPDLFDAIETDNPLAEELAIWQEAYEWSYFDLVLAGVGLNYPVAVHTAEDPSNILEHYTPHSKKQETLPHQQPLPSQLVPAQNAPPAHQQPLPSPPPPAHPAPPPPTPTVQAIFCIDDREYALRRHLQQAIPGCQTYGTPGFFGIPIYFQPEHGKFLTKCCPAPVEPTHVVVEHERRRKTMRDLSMRPAAGSLVRGWLLSNTLGFAMGWQMLTNLFRPRPVAIMADSFHHMDAHARLEYVYSGRHHGPYRVGFTPEEMAAMVHRTLSSMGLTHTFAPRIYIIAHGASSVNNPYYAGYDCGACSGRPGSVNARLFAAMANRPDVRSHLHQQYGLQIPAHTHFTGALHDTTRDEIEYYDLPPGDDKKSSSHQQFNRALQQALVHHARERALRFQNIAEGRPEKSLMRAIRNRSYTFFEPRPEWNHTDNALVIVGRPAVYERLYLDKRPFLNSYDYRQDPGGMALTAILSAAIPVCGGINLEYYFSRVDAQNWGAGTKLPHNVVGLFAVNNGIDGDVRPGLPSQMTEIHEPVRVLFIVEQKISVVNELLAGQPRLFEWVQNEWVRFAVLDPATGRVYTYEEGKAEPYHPLTTEIEAAHGPQSYRRVIQKSGPLLLCE